MFQKGRTKTGGIKKGTSRKATRELTAMIDGALNDLGGQAWLVEQGRANPVAFMALIGKRLPKDLKIGGDMQLHITIDKSV